MDSMNCNDAVGFMKVINARLIIGVQAVATELAHELKNIVRTMVNMDANDVIRI